MTGTRRLCARLGLRSIQFAGGIPCARGAMPNFCALTGSAPLLQYGSSPFEAAWASGAVAGATAPAQTQHFLSFSAAARQPSREEIDLHYRCSRLCATVDIVALALVSRSTSFILSCRAGVNELWPMTRQQRRCECTSCSSKPSAFQSHLILRIDNALVYAMCSGSKSPGSSGGIAHA